MDTISIHTWLYRSSNILFDHVSSVLPIIVSSRKFLQMNILRLLSYHQKCHPQCVGSRDVTHKAQWTLAKPFIIKPSGLWRNLLRNRVDFQQTFINQTDSLQDFSLIKNSHVPNISFSYVGRYPNKGN